jgi:hypothetical protein
MEMKMEDKKAVTGYDVGDEIIISVLAQSPLPEIWRSEDTPLSLSEVRRDWRLSQERLSKQKP